MSAEFNFYSDPEAANIVLSDLHAPITMACWELCLKHSLPWVSNTITTLRLELKSFIPGVQIRS